MDYVLAFVLGSTLSTWLTYTPIEKFEPDELLEFVGAVKNKFIDSYVLITRTGRDLLMKPEFDPMKYNKDFFTCDDRVFFLLDARIEKVVVENVDSLFDKIDFVRFRFYTRGEHPVFKNGVDYARLTVVLDKETTVLEKLRAAGIEVWALDEKTKERHPTYAWTGVLPADHN